MVRSLFMLRAAAVVEKDRQRSRTSGDIYKAIPDRGGTGGDKALPVLIHERIAHDQH